MRRNIGNEVVVAIIAVGVIAFAVIFGIVISVSNANQPGATASQITTVPDGASQSAPTSTLRPTLLFTLPPAETLVLLVPTNPLPTTVSSPAEIASATDAPTSAPTPTETVIETAAALVAPSATDRPTDVPTETDSPTPAPTETATQAQSETPVPSDTPIPSNTPTSTTVPSETPSQTFTPSKTVLPTRTPTSSETPTLPPTETFTPTPSDTFTPTETFTPTPSDTFTPTKTFTPTPSDTFTATASHTPTFTFTPTYTDTKTFTPSFTPSNTATFTPTFTFTPLPTGTPFPTRTPRPTATPTFTPLPTFTTAPLSGDCPLPEGWVSYTFEATDTLYALAVAAVSSVGELRAGNCLDGAETPRTGDTIALPRLLNIPVAVFEPVLPETALTQLGCTDAGSVITAPLAGETLDGVISVSGTAAIGNFAYFRVEVRPDSATIFNVYARSETPVTAGVLAEINTALYGSGLHWIRLTVVQPNGEFPTPCAIPVIFR